MSACGTAELQAPGTLDAVATSVLTAEHRNDAQLRVAFLPRPESCSPQDLIATRALHRLERESQAVAVLTLIPTGFSLEAGMDGHPFAGHVLHLPLEVLQQRGQKVRRPRFEVYGHDGQLLLLRPVYPYEEERLLFEELLSLLRFVGKATS